MSYSPTTAITAGHRGCISPLLKTVGYVSPASRQGTALLGEGT